MLRTDTVAHILTIFPMLKVGMSPLGTHTFESRAFNIYLIIKNPQ